MTLNERQGFDKLSHEGGGKKSVQKCHALFEWPYTKETESFQRIFFSRRINSKNKQTFNLLDFSIVIKCRLKMSTNTVDKNID